MFFLPLRLIIDLVLDLDQTHTLNGQKSLQNLSDLKMHCIWMIR